MPVKLIVKSLVDEDRNSEPEEYVFDQKLIKIGRRKENDVCIKDGFISGLHLKIFQTPNGYQIEDQKSVNGSKLNDSELQNGHPQDLKTGDIIEIPNFQITVEMLPEEKKEDEAPESPQKEEETGSVSPSRIQSLLGGVRTETPWFVVTGEGPDKGRQLRLQEMGQVLIIGRHRNSDLTLRHQSVSKKHAKVHWNISGISISDLGSLNGIFVNKKKVEGSAYLKDQDVVRIGSERLLFMNPLGSDDVDEKRDQEDSLKEAPENGALETPEQYSDNRGNEQSLNLEKQEPLKKQGEEKELEKKTPSPEKRGKDSDVKVSEEIPLDEKPADKQEEGAEVEAAESDVESRSGENLKKGAGGIPSVLIYMSMGLGLLILIAAVIFLAFILFNDELFQ